MTHGQQYFVSMLDDLDFKPCPEAAFEVQILNAQGQGETCVYFGRNSDDVLAVLHATKGRLPVESCSIPLAVINAARRRPIGPGEQVDETGRVVRPSFYPPE